MLILLNRVLNKAVIVVSVSGEFIKYTYIINTGFGAIDIQIQSINFIYLLECVRSQNTGALRFPWECQVHILSFERYYFQLSHII